jgi:hypothetical protein
MYYISSASERKHDIACTSWSSCLWKLCELVSNVEEQLCIVFMYTGTPISSPVIKKMCTFEVLLFCVWCLDNWSRNLSSKPFNTLSMARFKNIAISSDPHSPFQCHAYISFFSLSPFFSGSVIGVFGLFSCDPRFMAHIDSPWFVKFSKIVIWIFFINWDLWPETPPFFFSTQLWAKRTWLILVYTLKSEVEVWGA